MKRVKRYRELRKERVKCYRESRVVSYVLWLERVKRCREGVNGGKELRV
jgi:hypothetical protein